MAYTKYTQGNIYKITDNAYSECYIGSTVQALSNRMRDHRNVFINDAWIIKLVVILVHIIFLVIMVYKIVKLS